MQMPYIPKDIAELPDNFGVKVFYVNGKTDEWEVVKFSPIKETGTIEAITKDDIIILVPISSIQKVEYDKRFSKIVALRKKQIEEAQRKQ